MPFRLLAFVVLCRSSAPAARESRTRPRRHCTTARVETVPPLPEGNPTVATRYGVAWGGGCLRGDTAGDDPQRGLFTVPGNSVFPDRSRNNFMVRAAYRRVRSSALTDVLRMYFS